MSVHDRPDMNRYTPQDRSNTHPRNMYTPGNNHRLGTNSHPWSHDGIYTGYLRSDKLRRADVLPLSRLGPVLRIRSALKVVGIGGSAEVATRTGSDLFLNLNRSRSCARSALFWLAENTCTTSLNARPCCSQSTAEEAPWMVSRTWGRDNRLHCHRDRSCRGGAQILGHPTSLHGWIVD